MAGYAARTESFKTRRAAERWARSVEVEMDEGRASRNAEARRRTLGAAIERYLLEEISKKKLNPDRPKSQGQMHISCLRWWREQIGDMKLSDVTAAVVHEYQGRLARTPYTRAKPDSKRTTVKEGEKPKQYPRSAGSVNSHLRVLSHLFTVARKQWRWVTINPVEDVAPLPVTKKPVRALSDDERARLLAALPAGSLLQLLVLLALQTAARAGELLGLRWRDVSFVNDSKGKAGRLSFGNTKTDEPRIVWIHGDAMRLMQERRELLAADDAELDDKRVFPGAHGSGRFDYAPPFKAALAAAKITRFKFHNLRASAATYLASLGKSEGELRAIGGWTSNAIFRYVKHAAIDTRDAAAQLADKIGGTDRPK